MKLANKKISKVKSISERDRRKTKKKDFSKSGFIDSLSTVHHAKI